MWRSKPNHSQFQVIQLILNDCDVFSGLSFIYAFIQNLISDLTANCPGIKAVEFMSLEILIYVDFFNSISTRISYSQISELEKGVYEQQMFSGLAQTQKHNIVDTVSRGLLQELFLRTIHTWMKFRHFLKLKFNVLKCSL